MFCRDKCKRKFCNILQESEIIFEIWLWENIFQDIILYSIKIKDILKKRNKGFMMRGCM